MGARGVHFALTTAQRARLRRLRGDDEAILEFMAGVEDAWDARWLCETDKAWEAIHRALTDGKLTFVGAERHAPLGLAILGGESLVEDEDETVMLLPARRVPPLARALAALTEAEFRERYARRCRGYAPEFGDDDCAYAWEHLVALRVFFARVARARRAVVFTVSA